MKKIIILICTIFLLIIIWLTYSFLYKDIITSEEAIKIATNDVSNKDGEYIFNAVEYIEKDNVYILTFGDKVNYYTYKINAKTKKIISSKKEALNNNKNYIDEEELLNIVFSHANLNKKDCNLVSNLVTLEEGTPFYNTVFYNKNIRYEYKINAYTGSIISVINQNENAK